MEFSLSTCFIFLIASVYCFKNSECLFNGKLVKKTDFEKKFSYTVGIETFAYRLENGKKTLKRLGCTGGILNDYMILTAAHCFIQVGETKLPELMSIKINFNTLINHIEVPNAKSIYTRFPRNIYIPEDYFKSKPVIGVHDIAIIELDFGLPLSHRLHKLKLPMAELDYATRKKIFATGYGASLKIGTFYDSDDELRYLKYNLNNDEKPIAHYNLFARPANRTDHRGFCYGDNGGPLVMRNGSRNFVVVGVMKDNTVDCNDNDIYKYPGTFMNVFYYKKTFIDPVLSGQIASNATKNHAIIVFGEKGKQGEEIPSPRLTYDKAVHEADDVWRRFLKSLNTT